MTFGINTTEQLAIYPNLSYVIAISISFSMITKNNNTFYFMSIENKRIKCNKSTLSYHLLM